jgi:hypothetical protein
MIAIRLTDYPNCDENDGNDYFDYTFTAKEKEWELLCSKIRTLLKLLKKKDTTIMEFDCSSGGHGCILSLEASHVLSAIVKPITDTEISTLEKFGNTVLDIKESDWYDRTLESLDEDIRRSSKKIIQDD